MACGPPSADIRIGIVMNGPIPIMFDMLSAVACNKPKRRERETLIVSGDSPGPGDCNRPDSPDGGLVGLRMTAVGHARQRLVLIRRDEVDARVDRGFPA